MPILLQSRDAQAARDELMRKERWEEAVGGLLLPSKKISPVRRLLLRTLGVDPGYDRRLALLERIAATRPMAGGAQKQLYLIANGPMPTTAAQAVVTTGTAIKTMLQIKLGTQNKGCVVEWGISFDGAAEAARIKCELLETGTVFATVTASAAADITKFGDPNDVDPTTSNFIVGTAATGYTATAEGTITAVRMLDPQLISPMGQYVKQFPLGREPAINVSTSLRIRVTAPAAVNCYCYVVIEI